MIDAVFVQALSDEHYQYICLSSPASTIVLRTDPPYRCECGAQGDRTSLSDVDYFLLSLLFFALTPEIKKCRFKLTEGQFNKTANMSL